ncbi:MAG TPA: ATP-binding protein [Cyclobacteriaceae bacterium]|jgi:signal transduction histidine kinase|nr:ATP-binding protein [Cyclobacteriaceae bacterium]
MFWSVDTIGKRLFLSFSILAINVIIISSLSYHFITRNKELYQVSKQIDSQRIQIARLLKLDLDFLRFETINQHFYETQESKLLLKRDSLYSLIVSDTKNLHRKSDQASLDIQGSFDEIDSTLKEYNSTFKKIKEKILLRGFKDFGKEGIMRKYAHELESHSNKISLVNILTLRRHEKDYFLRRELQYKDKLNNVATALANELSATESKNDFLIFLLTSYKTSFNELASMDEDIGLTPTKGLLGKLNKLSNTLSDQLESLGNLSDQQSDTIISQSRITYVIISISAIIISFVLTYITALRLTRPIKKLSNSIGKFIVTQGLHDEDLVDAGMTNEITNLSSSFIKMTRKLRAQFHEIEKKSQLLEKRNNELQKLNNELDRFIYSAAHDLKSPLASLEGLIYLVKKEVNQPAHSHYFDKMSSSIEKMQGFIRDITDYAKNKRQQIKTESIHLHEMIDSIFDSLQFIPNADIIEKVIHVERGDFYTDRTRLEIILKNLLSNAIRYSDTSHPKSFVHVSVRVFQEKTIIRIEDNGIGIEDHHLSYIFDMFYRATDQAKGSGIGLFLVRESVKMLRGTITVNSEFGKGTTFILNLPNLKQRNVDHLPESEPINLLSAVS